MWIAFHNSSWLSPCVKRKRWVRAGPRLWWRYSFPCICSPLAQPDLCCLYLLPRKPLAPAESHAKGDGLPSLADHGPDVPDVSRPGAGVDGSGMLECGCVYSMGGSSWQRTKNFSFYSSSTCLWTWPLSLPTQEPTCFPLVSISGASRRASKGASVVPRFRVWAKGCDYCTPLATDTTGGRGHPRERPWLVV
jgi:hypothetical protein